jgi:hypothetical protein
MSKLINKIVKPGDVISSTDQYGFMTDLETVSSNIGTKNIRKEAVNYQHLDFTTENPIYTYVNKVDGTTQTITSTTYTTITDGANDASFILNKTLEAGSVIRFYGRVLTGNHSRIDLANDYYGFRFYFNIGAGLVGIGPEFIYSLSGCNTTNSGTPADDDIAHQNHVLSYSYIATTTTTLSQVQMRAFVQDNQNDFDISLFNFCIMISDH